MSYQERRALVSLASTLLINGVYAAAVLPRMPQDGAYAPALFHFWGSYFLVLIGVSIVARIFIHIVFSIMNAIATQEQEPGFKDERDRLIEMKMLRNSGLAFILGFVLAMLSLVFSMPPVVMFGLLLCSGIFSEVVSDISQYYFYRRGY